MRITYLVAQVVGYPAVGINVVEMLMQMFGQEPGYDGEILVVRVRQPGTILLRLLQRRRARRGWHTPAVTTANRLPRSAEADGPGC